MIFLGIAFYYGNNYILSHVIAKEGSQAEMFYPFIQNAMFLKLKQSTDSTKIIRSTLGGYAMGASIFTSVCMCMCALCIYVVCSDN